MAYDMLHKAFNMLIIRSSQHMYEIDAMITAL